MNKQKKITWQSNVIIVMLLILISFLSCEKDPAEPEIKQLNLQLIYPEDSCVVNSDSLILKWESQNAKSFDVLLDTISPPIKKIAEDNASDSVKYKGLTPSQNYYWQVVAKSGINQIESKVSYFSTSAFEFPHNPIPENNEQLRQFDVQLSWDCFGAKFFEVLFDTINPPQTVINNSVKENTLYIPELKRNTVYYWKTIAKFANGDTSHSKIWQFINMPFDSSEYPHNPSPVNDEITNLYIKNITWQCKNTNSFEILFDTKFPPENVLYGPPNAPHYPLIGLHRNTNYYWQVEATFMNGEKTKGEIWHFFNDEYSEDFIPHNPIPNNGATDQSYTNLQLNWECDYANYYNIYLDTISSPIKYIGYTQNNYKIVNLERNKTYYWKVTAQLTNLEMTESEIWSFTTNWSVSDMYLDLNAANLEIKRYYQYVSATYSYTSTDTIRDLVNYSINPVAIPSQDKNYFMQNDTIYYSFIQNSITVNGWLLPDTLNMEMDFYYNFFYEDIGNQPGAVFHYKKQVSVRFDDLTFTLDQNNYIISENTASVFANHLADISYYEKTFNFDGYQSAKTIENLLNFISFEQNKNFEIVFNLDILDNK